MTIRYKFEEPKPLIGVAYIDLGDHKVAIVDEERFEELSKFKWTYKHYSYGCYAIRRVYKAGRDYTIRMSRQVAETPKGMVCHHINRNPLDNRKNNLRNVTKDQHRTIHKFGENAAVID